MEGSADKAGIKSGDVILKINGIEVNSGSKLQEEVGKNRPGDKITVTLRRKGELKDVESFQEAFSKIRPSLDYDRRFAESLKDRPVVLGYTILLEDAAALAQAARRTHFS